jgi:hypothetical protein
LRLYYADILGADEKDALYSPLSKNSGSAFGASLLAEAYKDYTGEKLPQITRLSSGKPVTLCGNCHFSISHSNTHVLCALSELPIGVDTETHRFIRQETVARLTTPYELAGLSFFEIWVLRESLFKLIGEGNLRTMRFYRLHGKIIPPADGVFCRLYTDLEGSSTAVSSYDIEFPDKILKIPLEKLIKSNRDCF